MPLPSGALRVLGDFGFKRATVELVAKSAGVSHMTIYRRWPSKNDLLKAVIIGEFTTLLDAAFDDAAEESASFADRSLKAFTDVVWAVQSHPVVQRELNSESSDQLPILSSASSTIMEASVPLVAERLQRLGSPTADAPTDLDSVADVFVRLAYSLIVVKRPSRPLTTRAEVAEYSRECLGPYLRGVAEMTSPITGEVVVDDLEQRFPDSELPDNELPAKELPAKEGRQRAPLMVAAASLFSVLTLGAGMTAVLGSDIKLPFITPAGISKPTAPQTPDSMLPGATQDRPRATSGAQLPAPPSQQSSPGPLAPSLVVDPPARPTAIPPIETGGPAAAVIGSTPVIGSIGGNPAATRRPDPAEPVPALGPVLAPVPGTQPAAPGPKPPGPSPAPKPPGPSPAPKPPGPGPAPKPSGSGPAPKHSGSGSHSGQGQKQSGSGTQAKQQSGPSH
ncbi:MAG: TetR family transcriptional regulator [Mycobacterium sp.]|nr:TetR family transcriptional regulator [Mycobacterium sp.]